MRRHWLIGTAAISLAAVAGLAALRAWFLVVTVQGGSMEPAYHDGDLLLARRLPGSRTWRAGEDLVFARSADVIVPPGDPACLVKRVCAIPGDADPSAAGETVSPDRLVLRGLKDSGTRPPFCYSVPVSAVLGKVVTTLRRAEPQASAPS